MGTVCMGLFKRKTENENIDIVEGTVIVEEQGIDGVIAVDEKKSVDKKRRLFSKNDKTCAETGEQQGVDCAESETGKTHSNAKSSANKAAKPPLTAQQSAELAALEKEVEKSARKSGRLSAISFVWTILGTIYAIVSSIFFVAKKWVVTPYSYILIAGLAVYVVLFIVIICVYAEDKQKGKKRIRTVKRHIQIFKAAANLMFVIVAAISVFGVAEGDLHLHKWAAMSITIIVAAVQLGLRLAYIIFMVMAKRTGNKYKVKVSSYVNGKVRKSTVSNKLYEQIYKGDKE